MKSNFITAHRLAALSGLSRHIVLRLVKDGDLPPPVLLGKYYDRTKMAAAFREIGFPLADTTAQAEARA